MSRFLSRLVPLFLLAAARADAPPTAADLAGIWAGTLTHAGDSERVALHFEPGENGTMSLRASIPAMHAAAAPLGRAPFRVEGNDVVLGPFRFAFDRGAGTLTGTIPDALVPVHRMPIVLRRVERFDLPPRAPFPATVPRPVWMFDAGAPLWAGVTLADGIVYAGGDDGVLHAVEASTGQPLWSFRAGGAIRCRVTVKGRDLFFQADDGHLYRLDRATGAPRLKVRILETPIVRRSLEGPESRFDHDASEVIEAGGLLFVGMHDGRLLALDPATGARRWEFATGESILAAPAIAGGRIYFGSFDHHVYALEAKTGRLLWKKDTGAPVVSTPAVDGGRVIVGSRSYDLFGLGPKTGDVLWNRYFWFSWVESSAAIRNGTAYLGSSDGALLSAYETRGGRPVWRTDAGGWAWGQPAVTAERVYIGTVGTKNYMVEHSGGALAVDRSTGRAVWRSPAAPVADKPYGFGGSPAAGGGLVFFPGLDGRLYAFPE
jgi:outer membrane protein assembly factor BamB